MDLQSTVDVLASKQALHDLVTRVSRGVDRRDEKLILSCYHPDAVDDHGHIRGSREEFARYVMDSMADALGADPRQPAFQHSISNELFEIEGDTAWGETYVCGRFMKPGGEVGMGWARYQDRFERRDGEWRILNRRVIVDSVPAMRSTDTYEPGEGFLLGRHDMTDPSYERLG